MIVENIVLQLQSANHLFHGVFHLFLSGVHKLGVRNNLVRVPATWAIATLALVLVMLAGLIARAKKFRRSFGRLSITRKHVVSFGVLIALSILGAAFVFKQAHDLTRIQEANVQSDILIDRLDSIRYDAAMSWGAGRDYAVGHRAEDRAIAFTFVAKREHEMAAARLMIVALSPHLLPAFDRYKRASRAYDQYFYTNYLRPSKMQKLAVPFAALSDPQERALRQASSLAYTAIRKDADR